MDHTKLGTVCCDTCRTLSECRFEYLDPHNRNFPMLFCSLECMRLYVVLSDEAASFGIGLDSHQRN